MQRWVRLLNLLLGAFLRLPLWLRALVGYGFLATLCWVGWQLQIPERRPRPAWLFTLVLGPGFFVMVFAIARDLAQQRKDE